MATKKRSGLGRGLSALIPQTPATSERDIDVFFNGAAPTGRTKTEVASSTGDNTTEGKKPAAASSTRTSRSTASKTAATKTSATKSNASKSVDAAVKEASATAAETASTAGAKSAKTKAARTGTTQTATASKTRGNASSPARSTRATSKGAEAKPAPQDTFDSEESLELLPVPGARLAELDPYRIVPNAKQPRHEFDQDALDELIISVREFGVLQPVVVRPLAEDDPRRADGDFELIMGERRLRATKASGRTEIPAIIRETNDEDMLRDALLENLHRAELNPLEEASAYRQLLDDFGCTQDELAERIGRSRPQISNTLRLLNLPVDVQRRVAAGVLSAGHARAVLSVGEPVAMTQLADKIVNEQLSVRQAEAAAATTATRAGRAPRRDQHSDSLTAHLNEVGERLGDRLNTRVQVSLRKTKGTIRIDFASVADLNRILEELGEDTTL